MSGWADVTVERLNDAEALAQRVAEWLFDLATAKDGMFAVALAGGSTPKRLYEILASSPCLEKFPWARTHWYFGDERFVPPTDALSNFRMVREAMFDHAPVPAENIYAVPTKGLTPDQAATAYERVLKSNPAKPHFDAVLLGLGTDGHTASLFPGSPVLNERIRLVAAETKSKAEARITLTYRALESTRNAAFLVAGQDKRKILAEVRRPGCNLPAARLNPSGKLWLFADAAAFDAA